MPYGVSFTPGGETVLATDQQLGRLLMLEPRGVRKPDTVRIGGAPEGVVVDPSGSRAYVAEWSADELAVVALDRGALVGRVKICEGPRMMVLKSDP